MKNNIFFKPLRGLLLLFLTLTAGVLKAQTCLKELVLQPDEITGKDAYVGDWQPDNPAPENDWLLVSAWTISGAPHKWRTFINFDLSALPAGIQIASATLHLSGVTTSTITNFGNEAHACLTGNNNAIIRRITDPWSETTLTWNTQPNTTNLNENNTPALCMPNQNMGADVTDLVKDMIAAPASSFGFQIRLATEVHYRNLAFASSNHPDPAKRPRLTIRYVVACDCDDNIIKNGNFSAGLVPGDLNGSGHVDFWTEIKNGGGSSTPQVVTAGCTENGSLRMWGNQVVGEGVWQAVNFVKGEPYELRFCGVLFPIVQPNARMRFRATNNPALVQQYSYKPCQLPECQEIFLSPQLKETWDTYTAPIWTAAEHFNTFVVTV